MVRWRIDSEDVRGVRAVGDPGWIGLGRWRMRLEYKSGEVRWGEVWIWEDGRENK